MLIFEFFIEEGGVGGGGGESSEERGVGDAELGADERGERGVCRVWG